MAVAVRSRDSRLICTTEYCMLCMLCMLSMLVSRRCYTAAIMRRLMCTALCTLHTDADDRHEWRSTRGATEQGRQSPEGGRRPTATRSRCVGRVSGAGWPPAAHRRKEGEGRNTARDLRLGELTGPLLTCPSGCFTWQHRAADRPRRARRSLSPGPTIATSGLCPSCASLIPLTPLTPPVCASDTAKHAARTARTGAPLCSPSPLPSPSLLAHSGKRETRIDRR